MNTDSGFAGSGMNTDCSLSVFIRGYPRSSVLLFAIDRTINAFATLLHPIALPRNGVVIKRVSLLQYRAFDRVWPPS